ncbi:hypothetical protein CDG81_12165 [Actinopolyspora erythraea]|uniref:Uncharacterized protein n=1 Tax=Actinopolyspora erythraea TaxID=414996 RepID=A0A223RST0_9ACTN|nr:hypothetical protein CDG81_12165 [Actinopolyspora erythraea]
MLLGVHLDHRLVRADDGFRPFRTVQRDPGHVHIRDGPQHLSAHPVQQYLELLLPLHVLGHRFQRAGDLLQLSLPLRVPRRMLPHGSFLPCARWRWTAGRDPDGSDEPPGVRKSRCADVDESGTADQRNGCV